MTITTREAFESHLPAPLPEHISFNLMFDRLLMLEQLGLIPSPAAAEG